MHHKIIGIANETLVFIRTNLKSDFDPKRENTEELFKEIRRFKLDKPEPNESKLIQLALLGLDVVIKKLSDKEFAKLIKVRGFNERTALHFAAEGVHIAAINSLMQRGAYGHLTNEDKETLNHILYRGGVTLTFP